MSIDGLEFERSLRIAEQQEVIAGDENIMSDMYRIVTPEAVTSGLHIDFGNNRTVLERVVGALEVEESLKSDSDTVRMHDVMVATPGIYSFIGRAIPALSDLPLLDALDALQADRWQGYKEHGIYERVQVENERVTSQIVITNTSRSSELIGEQIVDLTKPGMVVGATYNYLPGFEDDDFLGPDLAGMLLEINKNHRVLDDRVGKIALAMYEHGESLAMPGANYFLKFGMLARSMIGSVADVHTNIRPDYVYADGRILATPDTELEY